MNINLNLYKYFYEVARCKSYTKADENLYISQPSLSYSIKTLEDQIGYKLFDRINNKIELTKQGQELFNAIEPALNIFSKIQSDEINGEITIGAPPLFGSEVLPLYINMLNTLYPELTIHVKIREYDEMFKDFEDDKLDIIICDKIFDNINYVSDVIKESKMDLCLFVGNAFRNNYNNVVKYDDIKNKEFALVETNKYTYDFENMYSELSYKEYFSTPLIINKLVKENLIGLAPKIVIENSNKVSKLNLDFELPKIDMTATYKKKNENSKIKATYDVFMNYYINEL